MLIYTNVVLHRFKVCRSMPVQHYRTLRVSSLVQICSHSEPYQFIVCSTTSMLILGDLCVNALHSSTCATDCTGHHRAVAYLTVPMPTSTYLLL